LENKKIEQEVIMLSIQEMKLAILKETIQLQMFSDEVQVQVPSAREALTTKKREAKASSSSKA